MGWQGTLLSSLVGPLYFSSIACGEYFDQLCIQRSIIERLNFMRETSLSNGFRVNRVLEICKTAQIFPDGLNTSSTDNEEQVQPKPWSECNILEFFFIILLISCIQAICWNAAESQIQECLVNGRKVRQ